MWLGTRLGRFWAWLFDGSPAGPACGDAATQIWVVARMLPRWAAGMAWGHVILVRRDCWEHPRVGELLAHEYVHVLQWRRYGNAFMLLYAGAWVWALLRYGPWLAYEMNWFEREARGEDVRRG